MKPTMHFLLLILLVFFSSLGFIPSNRPADKKMDNPSDTIPAIDYGNKSLKIQCVVTMNEGIVEWVLSYQGFKSYESFLQTKVNPIVLQAYLIGLKFKPVFASHIRDSNLYVMIRDEKPRLKQFKLFLTWMDSTGTHTAPLEYFFKESTTIKKPLDITWYFNGFDFPVDRTNARQIPLISKTHRNVKYSILEMNSLYLFDYSSLVIDKSVCPSLGTRAILSIIKL